MCGLEEGVFENSNSGFSLHESASSASEGFVCSFVLFGLLYNYMLQKTLKTNLKALMACLHLLYLLPLEVFYKQYV